MKAEFLRNLAGLFEACTVYTAAGLTCGGAAALATIACGGGATMAGAAGAAGFFLPAAPLYWYFTSDRAMEATFRRLDKWKQQKYINEKQAKELKEAALHWYRRRMFGRPFPPQDHGAANPPIPPPTNPAPPGT